MKPFMNERSGKGNRRLAVLVALAALLLVAACDKTTKEDKAKKAQEEIVKSLTLPPDISPVLKSEVNLPQDYLTLTYGSKDTLDNIAKFFKEELTRRGAKFDTESASGISYLDPTGMQITITWFAHDPDLSEFPYPTVFHVLCRPLPKDIRKFEEAKTPK